MSIVRPSKRASSTLALWCLLTQASPCGASGQYQQLGDHRIYCETYGSGRPLVLLHGGGSTIQGSFAHQIEAFAAHHRVIAIEQRGHGHSPDIEGPLSYSAMEADTALLLAQMGVMNADIVGYSDGAILALMLGIRHPALVHKIVASGANIDPHGMTEASFREAEEAVTANNSVSNKLLRMWLSSPTSAELSPALLGKLDKPVLLMAGDHDEIRLEHTVLIYRSLPHAKLWILPGTGHPTFATRPQWVNSMVLAFLE